MSTSRMPGDSSARARTIGSSLALSVTIVAIVLVILAAGAFLMFRQNSDDDGGAAAVIPSPAGTSELVTLGGTPTPESALETAGTPTEEDPDATSTATTPSPSPSASPTGTDEPTGTATEEEAEVEEPTATPEPDPPTEPPPTEEPVEEPTELPLEGDFGFLPPAQLPSGGVSSSLSLEYQLAMSLESLPETGTVYLLNWQTYTLEDVQIAREQLGLQGEIIEEGVGVYRIEAARGTLYVSPTEVNYQSAGFTEGDELPSDSDAIAIAREWVNLSAFVNDEMDSGTVVGRDDDVGRIVVKFRPTSPQPNLAPNPAATVTVGPGGTVLEVRIAWPASLTPSEYGYSDPLDVWQAVQAGQGFLEADISSVFATGALSGTATIVDYSTAYTLAGSPATSQYLVPVIRFEGSARIDQTGDEIPVSISIPVVYFEEGTAG